MINKEDGFTLIELLIVMTILSAVLAITSQSYTRQTDHQAFDYWYQQFELDLLYLQKHTMVTKEAYRMEIYEEYNKYEIRETPSSPAFISRKLPEGWVFGSVSSINPIFFTDSGQLVRPGSMLVRTNDGTYFITFPFGKARSYYVKNE